MGPARMETRVLSAVGKVAGLGGLALGVLLLIFQGLLQKQFLPTGGLNQTQAFAIMLAVLVFTFGIACIGLIAWVVAPKDRTTSVPPGIVALLAVLVIVVLLTAVFVSTQVKEAASTVAPDNKPNALISPPPPATPARPVDGVWDLQMICPDGSNVNEFGSHFARGRYARAFAGPVNGTTELAFGYTSEDTLRLTGYVYFDGYGAFAVDATGKKSGASLTGTGRFGTSDQCKLFGTEK
jgi:uncharacterized membrane protein (DUF485 family)